MCMINIAVVEDEEQYASQIKQYIYRYAEENNAAFSVDVFPSAESFLFADCAFDLVMMDIQLPGMDGMSAAKQLRQTNPYVALVFITSLAQFAIKGYEVGALDFMVKPFTYYNFALKFKRVCDYLDKSGDDNILIHSKTQTNVVRASDIYYVEIVAHTITYFTALGDFTVSGTMKKVCDQLAAYPFALCNQCYLVNLRYVQCVDANEATVNGVRLAVSRPRRKDFLHALNRYIAKYRGGCNV